MQLPNEIQSLLDDIMQDPTIEKYRCKYTWISGSSTEVYPIEVGPCDICIQLDWKVKKSDGKSFNNRYYKILERAMAAIADRHQDALLYVHLSAQDDSCPATMTFEYKDEFDLRKLNK